MQHLSRKHAEIAFAEYFPELCSRPSHSLPDASLSDSNTTVLVDPSPPAFDPAKKNQAMPAMDLCSTCVGTDLSCSDFFSELKPLRDRLARTLNALDQVLKALEPGRNVRDNSTMTDLRGDDLTTTGSDVSDVSAMFMRTVPPRNQDTVIQAASSSIPETPKSLLSKRSRTGLRGLTKTVDLFVSGIHPRTSAGDLKCHVEKTIPDFKIRQISHPDARSKSFLLSVPMSHAHMPLCPDFWPRFIRCRRFVPPRFGPLATYGSGSRVPCSGLHILDEGRELVVGQSAHSFPRRHDLLENAKCD